MFQKPEIITPTGGGDGKSFGKVATNVATSPTPDESYVKQEIQVYLVRLLFFWLQPKPDCAPGPGI
jgi:hypothetical protein